MAIAKRNVSVSRGYKPKQARVQRGPNIWQRARWTLTQNARELLAFAGDEIAYAAADTLQLLDYLRYLLRRAAPQRRELETFAQEYETAQEVSALTAEPPRALRVGISRQ
ncbi:hypothetical protein FBQ82_17740 [Anaerolineae bacterium CFX7]|nr:hypothetical protein [Anaerolineae bacterium CFX7]